MNDKPEDIEQYKNWLFDTFHVLIDQRTENHYELTSGRIRSSFEQSNFWKTFVSRFLDYNDEYLIDKNYNLFINSDYKPILQQKTYKSFLEKTYRKNALQNENWPNEPGGGWVYPPLWYTQIHDIVRTLVLVKYLDGVTFICDKIVDICDAEGLTYNLSYEAREEGYYAAHINIEYNCSIPDFKFRTSERAISAEIQVTTQLQEVIRNLLHKHYENCRVRDIGTVDMDRMKWQWDYKCDEFATNYLGHILHYVEGMILEIRDKQK